MADCNLTTSQMQVSSVPEPTDAKQESCDGHGSESFQNSASADSKVRNAITEN